MRRAVWEFADDRDTVDLSMECTTAVWRGMAAALFACGREPEGALRKHRDSPGLRRAFEEHIVAAGYIPPALWHTVAKDNALAPAPAGEQEVLGEYGFGAGVMPEEGVERVTDFLDAVSTMLPAVLAAHANAGCTDAGGRDPAP